MRQSNQDFSDELRAFMAVVIAIVIAAGMATVAIWPTKSERAKQDALNRVLTEEPEDDSQKGW